MKRGVPVPGLYVTVNIVFILGNGRRISYAWSVNTGSLGFAYAKAVPWGREELAKDKIKGRSAIDRIDVTVQFVEGDYDELDDSEK